MFIVSNQKEESIYVQRFKSSYDAHIKVFIVAVYSKYPKVRLSLNTGWSSSQNAGGHRILALQAQLVTAHGKILIH